MSSRQRCPGCNKNKSFALYIDTETSGPIHDRVGRCNREIECAYHYTPSQYFKDNGLNIEHTPYTPPAPKPQLPTSFIDPELFKKSFAAYEVNNFVKFLNTLFDQQTVSALIAKYFISTSGHWPGATVFWQIDISGKIRTGKVMLYNSETGKRVKEPFNYFTWAHKVLNLEDFNLKQCLFGEHLLKIEPLKPVAIVESEKTAILASVYLPQFIWLAVGGLSNLSADRCKVLQGRSVMLYPDLNAYDKWLAKGNELGFKVSDILEKNATDDQIKAGLNIADFLIKTKPKGNIVYRIDTYKKEKNIIPKIHTYKKNDGIDKIAIQPLISNDSKAEFFQSFFRSLEDEGRLVEEFINIDGREYEIKNLVEIQLRGLAKTADTERENLYLENLSTLKQHYDTVAI